MLTANICTYKGEILVSCWVCRRIYHKARTIVLRCIVGDINLEVVDRVILTIEVDDISNRRKRLSTHIDIGLKHHLL